MNNKGLIIVLIIVLCIIIIGLINLLAYAISGDFNGLNFGGRKSKNIIFEDSYKIADIEEIEVLSIAGNVIFEESKEDEIKVIAYGKDNNDIKVSNANQKLKVDYSEYRRNTWFNNTVNDIIISIPSTYSNEIKVNNSYGNLDMIALENATVNAKLSCGNIKVEAVKNANFECDYGDIKIEKLTNKCDIEADCGNVKIEKAELKENSSIKCDLGDIKIKEINDVYVDANVDLGDTKIQNNNRHADVTIKIKADCGNIKVGY